MRFLNKGFTLIELLVVIAVIGVLSTVVLASLSRARAKAKDSALLVKGRELQKAIETFASFEGDYPTSGSVLNGAGFYEAGNCEDDFGSSYHTNWLDFVADMGEYLPEEFAALDGEFPHCFTYVEDRYVPECGGDPDSGYALFASFYDNGFNSVDSFLQDGSYEFCFHSL